MYIKKPIKIVKKILVYVLLFSTASAGFIKLDHAGNDLPENATSWACVLDNDANLIWEVKTKNQDSIHYYGNSYTWFDGNSGITNGAYSHNCNWYNFCNTARFVASVNRLGLCGLKNWRLPSYDELITLERYPNVNPTIDITFFPFTKAKQYWTMDSDPNDNNAVLDVPFFYGGSSGSGKTFDGYIRLVNDARKTR